MNGRPKVELAVGFGGALLAVCAIAATQAWLDRHFLPSFVVDRAWYVRIEAIVRVVAAAAGVSTVLARRRVAALIARDPRQTLSVAAAVVLALGASEIALRRVHVHPAEWLFHEEEPRRQPDARLGWTLVPSRVGHLTIGGRAIEYAIDADGYRAARPDAAVDFARQTVVFAGESVIFGEGLTFAESIPAQLAAMTGLQTANLGVNGYSNDQAFLRLQRELPRFRRPVAVVSLFMPVLFGRNLDDDRPHLGDGLVWQPTTVRLRLASMARLIVPYRSTDAVDRGVTRTRDVLRAVASLARARGATPILIVPHIGPEDAAEAGIRRRVLDDGGPPYLRVDLDPDWHVASDPHPDARAARAIAAAIASRLMMASGRVVCGSNLDCSRR